MCEPAKQKQWMVETNNQYSKVVAAITSLATGSLVLPVLFLRQFLGVQNDKALAPFLNCWAYLGWGSLAFSIFLGLVYSWVSVKWVKRAWGQNTLLSEHALERTMDWLFFFTWLFFLGGVVATVGFFATVHRA